MVHPVDNAIRNTRVLARRAITTREDRIDFSSELCALALGVFEGTRLVSRVFDDEVTVRRIPE